MAYAPVVVRQGGSDVKSVSSATFALQTVAHTARLWNNDPIVICLNWFKHVIDAEGYRANVGIILCNAEKRLLWAKRIRQRSWQFPQGGIQVGETEEEAMFRELTEEIGLEPQHVEIIGRTNGWLHYRLPKRLIRQHSKPTCIGQKQIWFLLRMVGAESDVRLDLTDEPEFDGWRWVDYWYPLRAVVPFKRDVYGQALRELAPLLFPDRQRLSSVRSYTPHPQRRSAEPHAQRQRTLSR